MRRAAFFFFLITTPYSDFDLTQEKARQLNFDIFFHSKEI